MVICIIALPVLAVLGLFSLRYRILAGEAFRCLFRTVQLKPCDTGLDKKIKSKFTAKLMWWPLLARGFYKSFEVLSWIFVALLLLSVAGTGYGLYNYFVYGNCNGPDQSAFCVFNVVHKNQPECSVIGDKSIGGVVDSSKVKVDECPARGNLDSEVVLHEFGCYSCPYTKDAEPVVEDILKDYPEIKFIFHDVPLEIHNYSIEAGEGVICAGEQGKYWEYHDLVFAQKELGEGSFVDIALMLDLNISQFRECLSSNATAERISELQAEAAAAGIYGTPTFVIGEHVLVGPQNYKTLKKLIEEALEA